MKLFKINKETYTVANSYKEAVEIYQTFSKLSYEPEIVELVARFILLKQGSE